MKIHKGVRPVNPLVTIRNESGVGYNYQETLDNGHIKLWTNRTLKSGCNQEIGEEERMGGLIYCPHCDEYFSTNQFLELPDDSERDKTNQST